MTPRSVLHKHSKPRRSMLIVFSRLINMDVMCVARALLCFHTHVSSAFHMKALPPLGGHILSHRLTHKAASCLAVDTGVVVVMPRSALRMIHSLQAWQSAHAPLTMPRRRQVSLSHTRSAPCQQRECPASRHTFCCLHALVASHVHAAHG